MAIVLHARRQSRPDAVGTLILVSALVAAPAHMFALVHINGQGVTLGYLAGLAAVGLLTTRRKRIPARAGMVVLAWSVAALWGLLVACVWGREELIDRALRHWALLAFSIACCAAGATVDLRRVYLRVAVRACLVLFSIVVGYGIYQAFARRNGWPYAFLPVLNAGLAADPSGLQPGATSDNPLVYTARASSFFVEPTVLGTFLAYGASVGLALIGLRGLAAKVGAIMLALVGMGFAACQSMSGVLALSVIFAAFLARALAARDARTTAAAIAYACIGGAIFLTMPDALEALAARLGAFDINNSSQRFDAAPWVLEALIHEPWGFGMAGHVALGEVNSGALILATNLGIFGFLFPGLMYVAAGVALIKSAVAARCHNSGDAAIYLWASGTLLAHVAVLAVYGTLYEPFYWTLTGAALGTVAGTHRRRPAEARVAGRCGPPRAIRQA